MNNNNISNMKNIYLLKFNLNILFLTYLLSYLPSF